MLQVGEEIFSTFAHIDFYIRFGTGGRGGGIALYLSFNKETFRNNLGWLDVCTMGD